MNPTFLDIDESLRMRNLILPNKERDALDHQMDDLMKQYDSKPFFLVQPSPGICVKTRTTDGEKIFLNICVSDKIPAPKDISDTQLLELLDDNESAFIIPMSIGTERMEADKSDVFCATFDVMINSTYLKKCQEKKHFMAFTIMVALSGVGDKSGKELNTEDYIILKNRTVIGKLQQHRIQNREIPKPQGYKPLIEEISNHSTKPIDQEAHSQDSHKIKKGYTIFEEPLKGPAKRIIALFDMPKSISIEDIIVLMNSERINVTDEKTCCFYDVFLPYTLKTDSATAHFDYNIMVLRIDVLIEQK